MLAVKYLLSTTRFCSFHTCLSRSEEHFYGLTARANSKSVHCCILKVTCISANTSTIVYIMFVDIFYWDQVNHCMMYCYITSYLEVVFSTDMI